jgi:hypothetical protein
VLAQGWGRPRLSDIFDLALVGTCAFVVTWAVLVDPLLSQSDLSAAGMAVTVATPVLDVLLLIGLVQLGLRNGLQNTALRALVVGLSVQVAADFVYSYLNLKDAYVNGMWVDAGWIIAYGLFGVAALHPSMTRIRPIPRRTEARFSAWRVVALAATTLLPSATLLIDYLQGDPVSAPELAIVSVVVTVLVAGRLLILQLERNRILAAVDIGRE